MFLSQSIKYTNVFSEIEKGINFSLTHSICQKMRICINFEKTIFYPATNSYDVISSQLKLHIAFHNTVMHHKNAGIKNRLNVAHGNVLVRMRH